jgi:oxidoreductase
VFDFEGKEDEKDNPFTGANVVICALGSTIAAAGSKERFWKIDHDYVLKTATMAKAAGNDASLISPPHLSLLSPLATGKWVGVE